MRIVQAVRTVFAVTPLGFSIGEAELVTLQFGDNIVRGQPVVIQALIWSHRVHVSLLYASFRGYKMT